MLTKLSRAEHERIFQVFREKGWIFRTFPAPVLTVRHDAALRIRKGTDNDNTNKTT